jgi:hypothetical protein
LKRKGRAHLKDHAAKPLSRAERRNIGHPMSVHWARVVAPARSAPPGAAAYELQAIT